MSDHWLLKYGPGPRARMMPEVSGQRIDAALATLADLTTEEHPELTPQVRDAIARVRSVLHDIRERRGP